MTTGPEHPAVTAAQTLRRRSLDRVHLPGEEPYHSARLAWNLRFEPRPAVVVEASNPQQVRAAINVAREHELPLAVQSTGHGIVVPSDGGMLLTTSRMDSVTVDPERRTATVAGGAQWSRVIEATAGYGLAPLSGPPMVGVAGYTLGGGAGWLSRRYGLAADSVRQAQVVTADAQLLAANSNEQPDLYWALRGGGGNFGVVTSLQMELYPVELVYAWRSLHPISRAVQTMTEYRSWAPTTPDELNASVAVCVLHEDSPQAELVRGTPVLGVRAYYLGNRQNAERLLAPLLAAAGPPIQSRFLEAPYTELGEAIASVPQPPHVFDRDAAMFRELPDSVFHTLVAAVDEAPGSTLEAELRYWGGALAEPPASTGPAGHRDEQFAVSFSTLRRSPLPEQQECDRKALTELTAKLQPHATGSSFLNYLGDARAESAFAPEDHRKLSDVKQKYDPENVFRLNHNIPPTGHAAGR